MKLKSIPKALWILIFLVGCGQTDLQRIDAAARITGEARAADVWPELPADCRRTSRSGIKEGDRLDVALLKADGALARQNARTLRCADWYGRQSAGMGGDVKTVTQ